MSLQLLPTTWLGRADRVLWRDTPGGVVLLSMVMPAPVLLTGSGAALWELLADPIQLEEAAMLLAEFYGVPDDVVMQAILPVTSELVRCGAIVEVSP